VYCAPEGYPPPAWDRFPPFRENHWWYDEEREDEFNLALERSYWEDDD